jgi:hypothetical protein
MIVETILDVAGKLFGLKDQLSKARRDRRDRIAEYFATLGKTLGEVAGSLRKDEIPHGKCAAMQHFATELPKTVAGVVSDAEANDYARRLADAYEVEMLWGELRGAPDRERKLAQLERAAGLFEAIAATVRAAP